ncbi:acyl carrier protein [Spirillospora sp. NPDC052269]
MNVQPNTTDEITGEVLAMLTGFLGGVRLAPDQDYMAEGLIDSIMALELVTGIEEILGVEIDVDDLDLDNFRTAARISSFVRRKRAATADGGSVDGGSVDGGSVGGGSGIPA